MTDANDLSLLINILAQTEFLLYTLEQAVLGIGFYMNINKTGAISTLSGKPLKFVDQFTYLRSNISSTESDVNIHLVKAWNAIDRLLII